MYGMHSEDSEEEDQFSTLGGADPTAAKSRLGSLFSHDGKADGNSSLKYKAPKQPATKESKASSNERQQVGSSVDNEGTAVRVLHAAAIHGFVLQDGQYVSKGKLGLAVLGNRAKKEYKILLYLSNKQPIGQATITDSFLVTVDVKKYVHFLDDRSQSWSLAFDNEAQMVEFLKWFLAAKASVMGESIQLTWLDIEEGTGEPVTAGYSLELEYVENVVEDGPRIMEAKDHGNSESLRVRLGKETTKTWHSGLLGMKKHGKRLLLIPAQFGSGMESNDPNTINVPKLAFVTVKRLKYPRKRDGAVVGSSLSVSSENDNASLSGQKERTDEETLKESAQMINNVQKSISDTDVPKKTDLINRMAKIGQAVMGATTSVQSIIGDDPKSKPVAQVLGDSGTAKVGTTTNNDDTLPKGKPVAPPRATLNQGSETGKVVTEPSVTISQSGNSISDGASTVSAPGPEINVSAGAAVTRCLPPVFDPSSIPMVPYPSMPACSGSAMPYIYPVPYPSHLLQAPFLPPSLTGLSNQSSTDVDNRRVIEEIEKCHVKLQDLLTKTIMSKFQNVLKEFTGVVESKFSELQAMKDCPRKSNASSDPGEGNTDELLSKIDELGALIRNSTMNQEGPLGKQMNDLCAKIGNLEIEIRNRMVETGQKDGPTPMMTPDTTAPLEALMEKVSELQRTVDSMRSEMIAANEWKEKHDNVKAELVSLEEKYENRIHELESQLAQAARQREDIENSAQEKIKKIMNTFCKNITHRLPKDYENVNADEIRQLIQATVKESTLHFLGDLTDENSHPDAGADCSEEKV